jgi:hypothetical protein
LRRAFDEHQHSIMERVGDAAASSDIPQGSGADEGTPPAVEPLDSPAQKPAKETQQGRSAFSRIHRHKGATT